VLQRADASVVGYSGECVSSSVVGLGLEITSVSLASLQKVEIALKKDTFAFR
jgi:hypothetical protein